MGRIVELQAAVDRFLVAAREVEPLAPRTSRLRGTSSLVVSQDERAQVPGETLIKAVEKVLVAPEGGPGLKALLAACISTLRSVIWVLPSLRAHVAWEMMSRKKSAELLLAQHAEVADAPRALKSQLSAIRSSKGQLRKQLVGLEERIMTLSQQLEQAREAEHLAQEDAALQARVASFERNQLDEAHDKLDAAKLKNSWLIHQTIVLNAQVEADSATRLREENALEQETARLNTLRERIASIQREINDIDELIFSKEEEASRLRKHMRTMRAKAVETKFLNRSASQRVAVQWKDSISKVQALRSHMTAKGFGDLVSHEAYKEVRRMVDDLASGKVTAASLHEEAKAELRVSDSLGEMDDASNSLPGPPEQSQSLELQSLPVGTGNGSGTLSSDSDDFVDLVLGKLSATMPSLDPSLQSDEPPSSPRSLSRSTSRSRLSESRSPPPVDERGETKMYSASLATMRPASGPILTMPTIRRIGLDRRNSMSIMTKSPSSSSLFPIGSESPPHYSPSSSPTEQSVGSASPELTLTLDFQTDLELEVDTRKSSPRSPLSPLTPFTPLVAAQSPVSPRTPMFMRPSSSPRRSSVTVQLRSLDWLLGTIDEIYLLREASAERAKWSLSRAIRTWARSQAASRRGAHESEASLWYNVGERRSEHPEISLFEKLGRKRSEVLSVDAITCFLAVRRALVGPEFSSKDREHFDLASASYVHVKHKQPSAPIEAVTEAVVTVAGEHGMDLEESQLDIKLSLAADVIQGHQQSIRVHKALTIFVDQVILAK
ncbi:uncharacterized protein AMSG_01900 [Thecamonas trahens ATCC 50062]|uniref:Uncharacterized protein n=1 Tax=Thecamonas trahens ATCC 50062 TaxID=461836 RepID=A0A0L0DUB3_THETB|nr:hypothetical protein AMSG_01900 [Thecamonas trahens ATCC 50062]KNC55631.1 hypothetical protein AMSG_01900 [Thecamonas trahens ATCC 50062]|eukprot:XP_013761401.1 hypothetical protein AMSG_01900 [Thecamonas trahens ATCC 50062]